MEGQTLLDLLRSIKSDTLIYGVKNNVNVVIISKQEFPKMDLLSHTLDTWIYEYNGSQYQFSEDVSVYFSRIIIKMDGQTKKFPYFGRETSLY